MPQEIQSIIGFAGTLTVQAILFLWLWLERSERIKLQEKFDNHREEDVERMLNETEKMRLMQPRNRDGGGI